ncbi:hypothetical protein ACYJ5C_05810 [Pseudomonas amygdali pv. morsprunorum]|nr:hypothetical protein BKM19_015865 [Pseudomonas amygdali pv. morsprunorum]KWS52626.1 hypothetical protein AL056_09545 [Pseudomonas amygdali pv. morsprunorum]KWS65066.1 hypothetical protein AL054_28330 [Pseudomonas amygdali pv. morsprunorum]PHX29280.1 hypothetical protein AO282_05770 [Pseudomonas amygdali pv. morsprunorum]POC88170.1 hypothetical protein BKM08_09995 [Pseudomonas amygdali pv. morsprunorum]
MKMTPLALFFKTQTRQLLILAEGRGSEPGDASLVREEAGMNAENASFETLSSQTSEASPGSLPRPSGRSGNLRPVTCRR